EGPAGGPRPRRRAPPPRPPARRRGPAELPLLAGPPPAGRPRNPRRSEPMSDAPIPWHTTVGARIAAIPMLFILAMAGMLYYTVSTLEDQRMDSFLVEVSGRQRSLNQRHQREVLLNTRGVEADHASTRKLFLESVQAL